MPVLKHIFGESSKITSENIAAKKKYLKRFFSLFVPISPFSYDLRSLFSAKKYPDLFQFAPICADVFSEIRTNQGTPF